MTLGSRRAGRRSGEASEQEVFVRRMSLLWPTETDVSESLMTLPNLSNVRTPKILIGLEGAHVFC
jgi:hypothetical protein